MAENSETGEKRFLCEDCEVEGTAKGDGTGGAVLVDRLWKIIITGVLFCLLFREELLRLVNRWKDPKESHGLLIPAFSLYFIYQERERLGKVVGKSSFWGLVLMGLSIWGYLFSFFKGFAYPKPLMMIVMLAGIILFQGGWRVLRLVWLPVVFLVFAIPLPARLYYEITFPMRELASLVAAVILNSFSSIQCEATGVVIHGIHAGEVFNLNVAEACSGMRLLMAFLALGVAMAYLEYRPWIHRLVLLVSTVPIAIFCNMLRVLLTGLIYIYINPDWTKGTPHTVLGMAMLGVAFGLYGLLAWVMNRIYVEESTEGVLVVKK
jgi:exosortase